MKLPPDPPDCSPDELSSPVDELSASPGMRHNDTMMNATKAKITDVFKKFIVPIFPVLETVVVGWGGDIDYVRSEVESV